MVLIRGKNGLELDVSEAVASGLVGSGQVELVLPPQVAAVPEVEDPQGTPPRSGRGKKNHKPGKEK